jgi:hypothetical protein
LTLNKAQTDMKNAHVTPIVTVDQMTQHRALQVKAMLFHVAEGFFAPCMQFGSSKLKGFDRYRSSTRQNCGFG